MSEYSFGLRSFQGCIVHLKHKAAGYPLEVVKRSLDFERHSSAIAHGIDELQGELDKIRTEKKQISRKIWLLPLFMLAVCLLEGSLTTFSGKKNILYLGATLCIFQMLIDWASNKFSNKVEKLVLDYISRKNDFLVMQGLQVLVSEDERYENTDYLKIVICPLANASIQQNKLQLISAATKGFQRRNLRSRIGILDAYRRMNAYRRFSAYRLKKSAEKRNDAYAEL